jgi:tRNA pseudouridine32 synthase/23S rRNA pseudouridine746 synthase
MKNNCFIPFTSSNVISLIPNQLNDPFGSETPEICKIAAAEIQEFIQNNQHKWQHNFGFDKIKTGPIKGKMFGVLVVENPNKEIGYLCTFSGKLEDEPHPSIFVPSLFDISTNEFFITKGMTELTQIGDEIKRLKAENNPVAFTEIEQLKKERKVKSTLLQQELFSHYHFLNKGGKVKSLQAIFEEYANKNPAAGAGECAAPKLLQYAYEREMKPLAIAEFWWGESTKSQDRNHGEFYPACHDKCHPILGYMLNG